MQPLTGEIHICMLPGGKQRSNRLYYYQGNFYYPLDLVGKQVGLVKKGIREFTAANKELIARDRAHPDYKTLLQIFDEYIAEMENA
jgi:hypothetical protein